MVAETELKQLDAILLTPLIRYALRGLSHCWMPERGRWSHRFHLDGRADPNESVPRSDLYYSLNVILGLSRVAAADRAAAGCPDIAGLLADLTEGLVRDPAAPGRSWGMALWAASALGVAIDGRIVDRARFLATNPPAIAAWNGQDIALLLSGLAHVAATDLAVAGAANALRSLVFERLRGPLGLFFDGLSGRRREFSSFATQVYCGLALYHVAALSGDDQAGEAADACVRQLLRLQGPLGEWPWFYQTATARVVDPYQVYSVHQHGMGPALLRHAMERGVPGVHRAIEGGFRWLFGANAMGVSMLRPELGFFYRGQTRNGLAGGRPARALRASLAAITRGQTAWPDGTSLTLTKETRSYEHGWVLWSFGGRDDFPDLTGHSEFGSG